MNKDRWMVLVCLLGFVGIVIYQVHLWDARCPPDPKLKHYCTTVYAGLDMDADELSHGTPKRQEAAAMRFGELVTYHSEQEIALCAARPVDLSTRGSCMLEHDYACLAKLAHDAAEATKAR